MSFVVKNKEVVESNIYHEIFFFPMDENTDYKGLMRYLETRRPAFNIGNIEYFESRGQDIRGSIFDVIKLTNGEIHGQGVKVFLKELED